MKIKTPLQILGVCLGLAVLLNPFASASGLKSTGAAALGKMNALEARSAVPTPANLTRQLARPDAAAPWVQSMQRPAELVVGWTAELNVLSNATSTVGFSETSVTNVAAAERTSRQGESIRAKLTRNRLPPCSRRSGAP